MIIHNRASSGRLTNAKDVAMQPDMRLQQVMVFGMFLVMKFAISFSPSFCFVVLFVVFLYDGFLSAGLADEAW